MRGRVLGVVTSFGLLLAVIVVYFIFILEEAPPACRRASTAGWRI